MLDVFKNMKVLDPKIVDDQIIINDVRCNKMHAFFGWMDNNNQFIVEDVG